VHKDKFVPKYKSGKWSWDDEAEKFKFTSRGLTRENLQNSTEKKNKKDFVFKESMEEVEELVFRQVFSRTDKSYDADVIILQDIKNVALFLAPTYIMQKRFVDFVHTKVVDSFLNALIIYFEYFLKVLEYLLIRRDELSGKTPQIQSMDSINIKEMFSEYLTQYRILIAREYSKIIMENSETIGAFYHMDPILHISNSVSDQFLHEALIAFSIQVVWIAMHRKSYNVIHGEIDRLVRTNHFSMKLKGCLELSSMEKQVFMVKTIKQTSFLIQELINIEHKNLEIVWIGVKKYRGNNMRIAKLEFEFIVPNSQLSLADLSHGILGHPKNLYDTLLNLNWEAVRFAGYSQTFDPYRLVRQPYINIPDWDEYNEKHELFRSRFVLEPLREHFTELINNWKHRDKIVNYYKAGGILSDTILQCQHEIDLMNEPIVVRPDEILLNFLERKHKLRMVKKKK
uniref:Protein phosphatase 1 regulatory subunit 36 n=1 Tax=Megaselia scalaris TaxID=36166 RepID=T1GVM9_MEGSC